jgi:hypothetical protein
MLPAWEGSMPDRWRIRGVEWSNCNCAFGCPCQFNSPSTHGHCEAIAAAQIEEGHFGGVRLDGTRFVWLLQWPGEIAEGNGTGQLILDSRASEAQRRALRSIVAGEETTPGATSFYVFSSTLARALEPIVAPIELSIDVAARRARVSVEGLVQAEGTPLVDPFSGNETRAVLELPSGFEFTRAEVGSGTTRATAGVRLALERTHSHSNLLHMNQDGVIR